MVDPVLRTFLAGSHEQLAGFLEQTDTVKLLAARGDPPVAYRFAFVDIEHLVRRPVGQVATSSGPVEVAVRFPSDYLRAGDLHLGLRVVAVVTPDVFHPNIRPPAACLGDEFRPGTTIVEVVRLVYEILSYQNVTPDERNAFAKDACRYVREHPEAIARLRIPPLRRRKLNVTTTVTTL